MNEVEFNINDYVKVKLTERGLKIHREKYDDLDRRMNGLFSKHYPYTTPTVDSEGYSKWQLWDLMQRFGTHINLCGELPFETGSKFLTKRKAK